MLKLKLVLLVLLSLCCVNAKAQYVGGGPQGCLINKEENGLCPNDFLENVICWMDDSVCDFSYTEYRYRLDTFRYYINYYRVIAQDIGFNSGILSFLRLDFLARQELYEYNICLLDNESCYQVDNGLTIYYPQMSSTDSCPDPNRSCQGGPSDAAICQRMPEACTGNSGN